MFLELVLLTRKLLVPTQFVRNSLGRPEMLCTSPLLIKSITDVAQVLSRRIAMAMY